jgi:hypothetical protein
VKECLHAVRGPSGQAPALRPVATVEPVLQSVSGSYRAYDGSIAAARILNSDDTVLDLIAKEIQMIWDEAYYAVFRATEVGQFLLAEGREVGLGLGREQAREQGRKDTLALILQVQFGGDDRIPAVAAQLARRPDQAAALTAVAEAQDLDGLMRQLDEFNRTAPTAPATGDQLSLSNPLA